jgi:large subunit ribosomal protein L13
MQTFMARKQDIKRKWHLVDAEGMVLGRLASRVAQILRGKDKPVFTNHVDTGDFVIVVNAEKVVLTGNKLEQKTYFWHSRHPGGIKSLTAREMLEKKPTEVVWLAVKGMIPKGKLGRATLDKLKVYAGAEHPHAAQQPEKLTIQE